MVMLVFRIEHREEDGRGECTKPSLVTGSRTREAFKKCKMIYNPPPQKKPPTLNTTPPLTYGICRPNDIFLFGSQIPPIGRSPSWIILQCKVKKEVKEKYFPFANFFEADIYR